MVYFEGHFTHKTEGPWPLHFKHSHWWKSWSRSKFTSHYVWRTNGVCECKMDETHRKCEQFVQHCNSIMSHFFKHGLAHNVTLTYSVNDTTWAVYNYHWARQIGLTILDINISRKVRLKVTSHASQDRDHGIVRAQKKMSRCCPNTPPKIMQCGHGPSKVSVKVYTKLSFDSHHN